MKLHLHWFELRLLIAVALVSVGLAGAAQEASAPPDDVIVLDTGLYGLEDRQVDLSKRASLRYAVVIGNGAYENLPHLDNAVPDSNLMAEFLAARGYTVIQRNNVTKRGFEGVMQRLLFDVTKDAEVLFYYAGHGFQIGSENYIVPVDAGFTSEYDVPFQAVSLKNLVEIIASRARVQLIILDSCRNNPFVDRKLAIGLDAQLSAVQNGFSSQPVPVNSFLAFATSPGEVAYDGAGDNSPYTSALVEAASAAANEPVGSVLETVRRRVYQRTNGLQVPWDSSTLVETISFAPSDGPDLAEMQVPERGVGSPRGLTPVAFDTDGSVIRAEAGLERIIDMSGALTDLGQRGGDVTLTEPRYGALSYANALGIRLPVRDAVPAAALASLAYHPTFNAATRVLHDAGPLPDAFEVRADGETTTVDLTVTADPCDRLGGAHLDPEGVGFEVYDNDLKADEVVAACEAAVARAPENGRFHYQLGRGLLAMKRNEAALAAFERARDLGHTRAWYGVGSAIFAIATETSGIDRTKPVPRSALEMFAEGAERGDPFAFFALGRQLLRFETDVETRGRGFALLLRALEVGHTSAMNELGAFYLDPDQPEYYEPDRGLRYYQEAAAREDFYAYNNLGLVYQNGLGSVEPDPVLAHDWFRQAADAGHPIAPTNLGRLYTSGALGTPDYAQAVRWFDEGLARGDAWAGASAAIILAQVDVDGLGLGAAAMRAAKAAVLGNEAAAANARQTLGALSPQRVNAGAQALINALGGAVAVDGAFGAASETAMAEIAARHGEVIAATTPVERVQDLARLFWKVTKIRGDVF